MAFYPRREVVMAPQHTIRLITGCLAFLILVIILISTSDAASSEMSLFEPSAVRLAKIFVEGSFYAIITIGCAFSVYIATRIK